jgi:hypothetical protein
VHPIYPHLQGFSKEGGPREFFSIPGLPSSLPLQLIKVSFGGVIGKKFSKSRRGILFKWVAMIHQLGWGDSSEAEPGVDFQPKTGDYHLNPRGIDSYLLWAFFSSQKRAVGWQILFPPEINRAGLS